MLDRLFDRGGILREEFGSVGYQLYAINRLRGLQPGPGDSYLARAETYLEYAKRCGLDGVDIVHSCFDLAASLAEDIDVRIENERKVAIWACLRKTSLSENRRKRAIQMNLDPIYFHAILIRNKSFEGRAFDPSSDKDYADIREGDLLRFTLTSREFWHKDECRQLGLEEGMLMEVDVGRVLFSPLVHWLFEFHSCDGRDFQPTITGDSELLRLQSAGVYYSFPGYPERISNYGFLGIEVLNPKLIEK